MAISSLEKQDYELLLPYMPPSGWIRRALFSEFQGGRLWPVYEQMGSNDSYVHQQDGDRKEENQTPEDIISCCQKLGMILWERKRKSSTKSGIYFTIDCGPCGD